MTQLRNWVSKGFSILVVMLTSAQIILPTYATETDMTTTSNISVEVKGEGTVKLSENGNEHEINSDNKFTATYEAGTSLHFDIEEQDNLYISSFTENGEDVDIFDKDTTTFSYDATTTESDATYVISFDKQSKKEDSGVSDETQAAEDEDVGNDEEDYGISLFSANDGIMVANDSGGAGGGSGNGGGIMDIRVKWCVKDDNSSALGWALTGKTSGSANVDAVLNVLRSSNYMNLNISDLDLGNDSCGTRAQIQSSLDAAVEQCKSNYYKMYGTYNGFQPRIVAVGVAYLDAASSGFANGRGEYHGQQQMTDESNWKSSWQRDTKNAPLEHNNIKYTTESKFHNGDTSLTSFALSQLAGNNNIRIIVLDETEPEPANGSVTLKKASSNTAITNNNSCYGSMEGATYGVYSDSAATKQVGTLTVKADGTSNKVESLKAGTYYVKETKAPTGYALDSTIHQVTVEAGKTATVSVEDTPQSDPVGILLGKVDATTNKNKPLGSASLADAQFTVKYYDGYYKSESELKNVKATKTWVLKTNENGFCYLSDSFKVSGDDFYYHAGYATLPLGTVTIQETKAPTGYKLNDELFIQQITSKGTAYKVYTYTEPTVKEEVLTGQFQLTKLMADGDKSSVAEPETGAKFAAVLESYYSQAGGDMEKALSLAKSNGNELEYSEITTDSDGVAKSGKLAYGTYIVKQMSEGTNGSEAEILTDTFKFVVSEKDNEAYVYGESGNRRIEASSDGMVHYLINNVPFNSYVSITKVDKDTGKSVSLNNASFQIYKTDKDGNIDANYSKKKIKTDENGLVSLKSGLLWYNTFVTNSDNHLSILDVTKYEASKGEAKGSVALPVELPVGYYKLVEVDSPQGYLNGEDLNFQITKSNVTGTDDDGNALLSIVYEDPTPKGKIKIIKSFEDDENKMHGKVSFDLIVTEDIVDPADGSTLYKAGDVYGTYDLDEDNNTIEIDELPLGLGEAHYKLVESSTYENYQLDTTEYAVDFTQNDQTTKIYTFDLDVENKLIKIGTTALNKKTGESEFNSAKKITVVDEVQYEGLTAGQKYTMNATLMDKTTGEAVKDADGNEVTGTKTFTPDEADGTVKVEMTFDATTLSGEYVVFESLLNTGVEGHEDCEIASHKDIEDKDQTITIKGAEIGTTAKSENGSHEQQVTDGEVTLTDTVSYKNLVKGEEYTVKGTLMNKETGDYVVGADGKQVTGSATFTAEKADGTVDVTFKFDASNITSGTQTVVFETLYIVDTDKDGNTTNIEVTDHKDITDEGQSVNWIDLHTNATSDNGTNEQQATDKKVTITDKVSYEGLTVGKEYTVKGTLMNKSTNKAITVDGKEVTAEKTFTAKEANGSVDLTFTFDASGLKGGTSIVVFEDLYRDDIKVGTHSDITDKDQTINITELETTATSERGSHKALAGKKVTITDKVQYTNLEVGKEYTVKGTLMNKETGKALEIDGKKVTAETTFTPKEANGSVDLTYTLDSSDLAGKETVVFEDLYKDGIKVASHSDLNDESQTVEFKNYEVLVNKVDSVSGKNITNNKFEFTMFSDKDCTKEITTVAGDKDAGTAKFEVTEGTWYIKETKAPTGYKLSNEVVTVKVENNKLYVNDKEVTANEDYVYSIVYQNSLTAAAVKTAARIQRMKYMIMAAICLIVMAILYYFYRKDKKVAA